MTNPPELLNSRNLFSVSNATRLIQVAESLGVFALLMVVVIGASIIAPGFFTYTNLINTVITARNGPYSSDPPCPWLLQHYSAKVELGSHQLTFA